MTMENVAYVGQQVKNEIAEVVEKTREFPAKFKKGVDVAYKQVAKGVRRTKAVAEEAVDDTRRNIKANPFAAVGIAAGVGVGVGVFTAWMVARRRR
jgi:ElaB/YqjD/DUF883 family membrane-anchored ribosome-binding protein